MEETEFLLLQHSFAVSIATVGKVRMKEVKGNPCKYFFSREKKSDYILKYCAINLGKTETLRVILHFTGHLRHVEIIKPMLAKMILY